LIKLMPITSHWHSPNKRINDLFAKHRHNTEMTKTVWQEQ